MNQIDPSKFTDREKEIAQEGYRRGYVAAERFWKDRLMIAIKMSEDLVETLEGKVK